MDTKVVAASLAALAMAACGGSKSEAEPSYAEAFSHVADARENASAKVQAAERMDALQAKAEKEAEAARAQAFAELITVPADVPPLPQACADAASAYDGYKTQRLGGDDLQRWTAVKAVDLGKLEKGCLERGDPAVAACQSHALSHAPGVFAAEDAEHVLTECEQKVAAREPKTAAG